MDADRFDFLARSLTGPTRRRFSRVLAGITMAGGLGAIAGPAEVDGKKKGKGKKKKKKCKGATKKCGKKCIPETNCCTSADCDSDNFFHCINGVCDCIADGWKSCGNKCVQDHDCCSVADCGSLYDVCVDNHCQCSGFTCDGNECCAEGEVCNYSASPRRCEPGPCPNFQLCDSGDPNYLCGHGVGVCTTTASGGPVCVEVTSQVCMACTDDAQCAAALGSGAVCVNPGGCTCGGTPYTSFCARTIPV